jgi:hypothetical protein
MQKVSLFTKNLLSKSIAVTLLAVSAVTIFDRPTLAQTTAFSSRGRLETSDKRIPSDNSPYDLYSFNGITEQEVTIHLDSRDFDTYLMLLDATGNILAQNDDTYEGRSTNSSLSITLPSSGEYSVVAGAYNSSARGSYSYGWIMSGIDGRMTQFQSSDSICNTAFEQLKKKLVEGRELTIAYQGVEEMNPDENYPEGRPLSYRLDIRGKATSSILNSPRLLMSISRDFLGACTSAGTVTISDNRGTDADLNITFGLVDGQVTRFLCVDESSFVPWGSTQSCHR